MKESLKDILSRLNPDIDQETLLRYLEGKLSPQEQHDVEKQMVESEFDSDAMEGLQDFSDKKKIASMVEQLNRDLKKRTEKKRKRRKSRELHLDPWVIIAIVLILALVVAAYFIIHRNLN